MQSVSFDPVKHIYTCSGVRYLSATQLLHYVKNEFDTDAMAELEAEKRGGTAEHWKRTWEQIKDRSLDRGNAIHETQEELTMSAAFEIFRGRPMRVRNAQLLSLTHEFKDFPDGVYTEEPIWHHYYRIAGKPDKFAIETIGPRRYVDIDDYKTNRRFRLESFFNNKTQQYKMLKEPLSHIMECEYWVYSLQLSLYALMFEFLGFIPRHLRLIHFPHIPKEAPPGTKAPKPVPYEVKYLKDDVIKLLNHLKRTRVI